MEVYTVSRSSCIIHSARAGHDGVKAGRRRITDFSDASATRVMLKILLKVCETRVSSLKHTADIISTVEFDHTGNYLATGDKGGRVVLFERNESVCLH
jgi:hypothetical protein